VVDHKKVILGTHCSLIWKSYIQDRPVRLLVELILDVKYKQGESL